MTDAMADLTFLPGQTISEEHKFIILSHILWRRRVGIIGLVLTRVTFGLWARHALADPEPTFERLDEQLEIYDAQYS